MKETLGNVKSTRFCVTVIGSAAVGKTALTVQYLTGRFIGEYFSGSDMTYRHTVPHFGGSFTTNVDILDISRSNDEMEELIPWTGKAGAFLVVYSLTNAYSFKRAQEILAQLPVQAPKYLVANQLDLQHRRQVSREDGLSLANQYGCPFNEFSAAETNKDGPHDIKVAFQKLIRQLMTHAYVLPSPLIRFSAFSKLLGAFVSKTRPHVDQRQQQRYGKLQRVLSSSSTSSKYSVSSNQSLRSDSSDSILSDTLSLVGAPPETLSPTLRRNLTITSSKCFIPIPMIGPKAGYTNTHVASI